MATIDDIRIKLGVDATDIKTQVGAANRALDDLRKTRTSKVALTLEVKKFNADLASAETQLRKIAAIPLRISAGEIDAEGIEDAVRAKFPKGLPIPVRLDTEINQNEARQTRQDLAEAIGTVVLDWTLAPKPKGGWPAGPGGQQTTGPSGDGGGGGGARSSGGGGGRTRGGGGAGGGGGTAATPSPAGPSPERQAVSREISQLYAKRKRAKDANDQVQVQQLSKEIDAQRARQVELAKAAREQARAERAAAATPAPAPAPAPAPTPAEPAPAAGLGGRKVNARRAATRAKEAATAAAVPTGAPQAGNIPTTLQPVIPTPTTGGGKTTGRRVALGAPEKGAFVGKGTSKNFRGGSAPRPLAFAAEELTPAGLRKIQALIRLGASEDEVHSAYLALKEGANAGIVRVAAGETPRTVNPGMRRRKEIEAVGTRARGLEEWVEELGAAGVEAMKPEDARRFFKSLTGGERTRVYTRLGLPMTEAERLAAEPGSFLDPLKDPQVVAAFVAIMKENAEKRHTAIEQSGGAVTRLTAGARGRRGEGPRPDLKGGGITLVEPLKTETEKRRMTRAAKKARAAELAPIRAEHAARSRRAVQVPPELAAEAKEVERQRKRGGKGPPRAMLRADAVAGTPSAKAYQGPDLSTLAGAAEAFEAGPPSGLATAANYGDAYVEQLLHTNASIRAKQGLPRLTLREQQERVEQAKMMLASREDAGLPRLRLRGYAEGGEKAGLGRIHGTYKWRQMSLRQRAFQPFCTYCGTFGSPDNPLQGEHINEIAQGGSPFDPRNVTTSCKHCNLAKRGKTGWGPPGRADGGEMDGGGRGRIWRFVVDGVPGSVQGSEAEVRAWLEEMKRQGRKVGPGKPITGGPASFSAQSAFIKRRGDGGRFKIGSIVPYGKESGLPRLNRDFVGYELAHTDRDVLANPTLAQGMFPKGRSVWPGPYQLPDDADLLDEIEALMPWWPLLKRRKVPGFGGPGEPRGHAEGGSASALAKKMRRLERAEQQGYLGAHLKAPHSLQGFQRFGRPGIHLEWPQSGRSKVPNERGVVARSEEGELQGALLLFSLGTPGSLIGPRQAPGQAREAGNLFPYVRPEWRSQGIGSRLYRRAADLGFNVEELSDLGARSGSQTDDGHRLWRKRKLNQGWTKEEITAFEAPKYRDQKAEGGYVKHMGTRFSPDAVTLVGERGPELIVQDATGNAEVIPTHQVPSYLQDLRGGKFGRRDVGGTMGGPIRYRGARGQFISPEMAAMNAGATAQPLMAVQRVFIVNWPPSLTGQGAQGSTAAGAAAAGAAAAARNIVWGSVATQAAQQPTVAAGGGGQQPQPGNPPGPAPGAVGVAGAQLTPTMRPSEDPLFRAQMESRFRGERFASRQTLQSERTRVAVALAENPVRAFAVAFSQVLQTKGGRGALLEAANKTRVAIQEADAAMADFAKTSEKLEIEKADQQWLQSKATRTQAEDKELAVLNELIPQREQAAAFLEREYQTSTSLARSLAKGLGGTGAQLKNLSIGLASVIGGGLAMRTAFTAVATALGVGTAAAGELIERTTGYRNEAVKLSETLAKQTRATQGSAEAATAAALAQSGLNDVTAARIAPALTARAAGIAGNQAFHEQTIQIAAARNFGIRPGNLPPGFDTSLVRSTGGPFDLGLLPGILSDRSFFDELAIRMEQGRTSPLFNPATREALAAQSENAPFGIDAIYKSLAGAQTDQFETLLNAAPGGALARGITQFVTGQDPVALMEMGLSQSTESMDALNATVGDLNAQAKKGGAGAVGLEVSADAQAVSDTIKAFAENLPEDSPFLKQLEDLQRRGTGVALTGGPINQYAALGYGAAIQRSGRMASAQQLINQLTAPIGGGGISQLDVQLRDIARRGEFQRETVTPARQALALAARPIAAYGEARLRPSATLPGAAFADTEGTIGQYQAAFEKYAEYAEPAQERINAQIAKGRETLNKWVGEGLVQDIASLGANIQDIQLNLQQRGLNLQVSQYNNEIRMATRSLGYAKDFTKAIKGNVSDTVGGLQGQNYQLSRQLQLLGFELQQRQINLNLALAGFQAPGETSAERAARQDDARAQAEIAQKQLNLQRQIGGSEFTIGLKQNADAVTDLTAQIALLREGKAFAIDEFAATEAIKRMEAELGILEAEAQQRFDEQVQRSDVFLGIIADVERATGETFDKWQNKLYPAWRTAGREAGKAAVDFVMAAIPSALLGGDPMAFYDQGRREGGGPNEFGAAGLMFDTQGPTSLTVGEAGTETVAVLRNPRRMELGSGGMGGFGGGGGMAVQIIFNNPVVKDENDINVIVRKVEEALNRRTQLLGLR